MKLSDMKIVAGLGSLDAFDAYVDAGADELFAGFIPAEWLERYGVAAPLNRREVLLYPTQIASMADMRTLSRLSREANVPVSLTFNATFYAPEQYEAIRRLIDSLLDIGFSRFILADPALLLHLRRAGCRARVHLSGEMGAFNVPALSLLDGPDVSRFILHRKTGLDEMAKIARAFPERELEAFVLNERCCYTGALCNSLHADELPHLCRVSGEIGNVYDAPASPAPPSDLFRSADAPHTAPCSGTSCYANEPCGAEFPSDASPDPDALGASGCGLCALPALRHAGVTHLKLVGRGNRPERMVRDIRALKTALSLCESDFPAEMKRRLFPNGCAGACYYRIEPPDAGFPASLEG